MKKRLRMTLDFEVTINEITEESLREHCRMFTNSEELIADPETHKSLVRQQRLQHALLADEESLRRFLTYVVVSEVNSNIGSRIGEMFGVGREETEEEILGPVFERLDVEGARFYREANAADLLWEYAELLSNSFVGFCCKDRFGVTEAVKEPAAMQLPRTGSRQTSPAPPSPCRPIS